ncbi:MAG: hypothetical protein MUE33_12395 [Cytophagaceae bacterium]|jgi:hypothetical protein|nr:hypothetical protein [Cytophagaceae bacterium]
MKSSVALFILKIVCFAAIVLIAIGFGFMYLWNWLMPYIFQLPTISFFQGLGILLLSKLLFSGWGKKCCSNGCSTGGFWQQRWKKHTASLSEEEKARLKERIFSKCMRS